MIEVTDTLKRKNNRYHTVVITPTISVSPPNLNLRVYRYHVQSEAMPLTDPKWGTIPVDQPLIAGETYEFRLALKDIPADLIQYEIGLVKEGVRWLYSQWLKE